MTIKLRDYLRLHPNQGVELLTEFGYYNRKSKPSFASTGPCVQ